MKSTIRSLIDTYWYRFIKRELKCCFCGRVWSEHISLRNDEPDDEFDNTVCDECEKEWWEKHE